LRWAFLLAPVSLFVLVGLVAACTGRRPDPDPSPSTDGDKAALCQFDTDFHRAGESVKTEQDSVRLIRSFEPRFDEVLRDAPSEVRPAVETLIEGLRGIARTGDLDAVDSPEAFSTAGKRLDTYCGISPS